MRPQDSNSKRYLLRHTRNVGLVGFTLVALGVLTLDQRIEQFFQKPEVEIIYYYSREITNIGYASHYILLALFCSIVGRYFSRSIPYLRQRPELSHQITAFSALSLRAFLAAGLVVQLTKILVGRQRPHASEGLSHLIFDPINIHWHWHSFPSGHTQVMLTVATVLSFIWPKQKWVFLSLGTLLAFTRVVIHQHFFSDFIGGLLVGYLATIWVYWKWPPAQFNPQQK